MKKSELKKVLKPLIRECVKEVILDEGVLSGIISEVARGFSGNSADTPSPQLVEEAQSPVTERMRRNAFTGAQSKKLQEQRKQLMKAVGAQAYNGVDLFEGTTPAPAQGSPLQQAAPLAGVDSSDPGVDISSLFGTVGQNWAAHMDKVSDDNK